MILPFTILRRLDCILEPTKSEVLAEYKKISAKKVDPAVMLKAKFKLPFYNTSRWTFDALVGDPEGVADNLIDYIERFSPNVRDVFDGFRMIDLIGDLSKSDRLYLIVKEFAAVDLHPKSSPITTWVTSSKNSFVSSPNPTTPRPVTTSPPPRGHRADGRHLVPHRR